MRKNAMHYYFNYLLCRKKYLHRETNVKCVVVIKSATQANPLTNFPFHLHQRVKRFTHMKWHEIYFGRNPKMFVQRAPARGERTQGRQLSDYLNR